MLVRYTAADQDYDGPSDESATALNVLQREKFYNAACRFDDLVAELAARSLMDFGLRVGELTHLRSNWVQQEPHPKTGDLTWRIQVPPSEVCVGGVGETGQGNEQGCNMHLTNEPCWACRTRDFEGKSWVDEQTHEETPFHPKTKAAYQTSTWALPTNSCQETARLLKEFLSPNRQWPTLRGAVSDDLSKIRKNADMDRDVAPHALRHTYGMRLAAAEKSLNDIMNQMRHDSLAMARYYSNEGGTDTRDAIQRDWKANEAF